MTSFIKSKWNAASVFLCLSFFSIAAQAQRRPLSLNTDGVDQNSDDPVEVGYQIAEVIVFLVLVCLSAIFLIVFAKQLIKAVNEAREDGRWEKVGSIIAMGIVALLFLVFLFNLAIGLF